jgi:hypothetical protein
MIEVGDLVCVPMSKDNGIVLKLIEHRLNDYDLRQEVTLLAEVFWQNMGRSRLEMVSDLKKLTNNREKSK